MSRLTDAALRFRAQLLRQERAAAREMVRAYAAAWRRLRAELSQIEAQIAEAQAAGLVVGPFTPRQPGGPVIAQAPGMVGRGTFSVSWVYRRERLLTLLGQVEQELRQFGVLADELTVAGQLQAVQAAQANAQALMAEAARAGGAPELVGMFNRLSTSAVEELVGFASDGSPLRELFEAMGERTGRGVREALETAVATGMGPRETARLVRQQFGMGLSRALTIARTEQIRAYREASGRTYEANADVLDGWVWLSAADARTCASCLAMHGSVHAVQRRIDSHPNCRCVMLPRVKGARIEIEKGEDLFAQMTPAQQDAKLGKAAGAAYRAGAVKLADFVEVRRDPDWGDSRHVKSLRAVVGESEAKRWMQTLV
jgi:SPP1 gp7 family putative phage head morphogenesis protein